MFNEHFGVQKDKEHLYILGSDAAAKAFIKYIEPFMFESMGRKRVWSEKNFTMCRIRPHLQFRQDADLNNKELSILKILYENGLLSSFQICANIGWLSNNKPPSSYFRYLTKFLDKKWVESIDLTINGKHNIKYKITHVGIKIYNEAVSVYR